MEKLFMKMLQKYRFQLEGTISLHLIRKRAPKIKVKMEKA